MVKELVCSLKIDRRAEFKNKKICFHIVNMEHGGFWKSGWIFEAASIEFGKWFAPTLAADGDKEKVEKATNGDKEKVEKMR